MNQEQQQFIEAIENDEQVEIQLAEGLFLSKDTEFMEEFGMTPREAFNPTVVGDTTKYSEEEIDQWLHEKAGNIFDWDELEFNEKQEIYYPVGIELKV